jgi:hypothetical protein
MNPKKLKLIERRYDEYIDMCKAFSYSIRTMDPENCRTVAGIVLADVDLTKEEIDYTQEETDLPMSVLFTHFRDAAERKLKDYNDDTC